MMAASMKVAVVRFPGSNCDLDAVKALRSFKGISTSLVWHEDPLSSFDAVVLPGGFSFGDALRAGAIAARSPAISRVARLADRGVPVLGICNGFQVLIEAGLLPGALLRNTTLRFVCRWVNVRVEGAGEVLQIPIKHGEGQFVASEAELGRIEAEGMVALRYCAPDGSLDDVFNPNGASHAIAGLWNESGNVLGLMPHPEHAVDPDLGPTGGHHMLQWLLTAASSRVPA